MYKKFDSLNFINFCIAFMGISSKITEIELKSPKGVSMILDCENCIRLFAIAQKQIINTCITMMNQKKIHILSMPILTIKTNGIYQNHFFLVDLKMLNISKSINLKKTET